MDNSAVDFAAQYGYTPDLMPFSPPSNISTGQDSFRLVASSGFGGHLPTQIPTSLLMPESVDYMFGGMYPQTERHQLTGLSTSASQVLAATRYGKQDFWGPDIPTDGSPDLDPLRGVPTWETNNPPSPVSPMSTHSPTSSSCLSRANSWASSTNPSDSPILGRFATRDPVTYSNITASPFPIALPTSAYGSSCISPARSEHSFVHSSPHSESSYPTFQDLSSAPPYYGDMSPISRTGSAWSRRASPLSIPTFNAGRFPAPSPVRLTYDAYSSLHEGRYHDPRFGDSSDDGLVKSSSSCSSRSGASFTEERRLPRFFGQSRQKLTTNFTKYTQSGLDWLSRAVSVSRDPASYSRYGL